MTDELPTAPSAPEKNAEAVHQTALDAFKAHAQDARVPLARARSVFRSRIEPYLIAAAALGFAAWAIWRVFLA
jgi:hypothetical protein